MIVGRGIPCRVVFAARFIFSWGQLRSIERFRTVETVKQLGQLGQLGQLRQLRQLKQLGQLGQLRSIERLRTLKAKCRTDGLDGMDWLSYTDVTPRASLQSDANNIDSISFLDNSYGFNNLWLLLHVVQVTFFTILFLPQTISAVWVQWRPEARGAKVNVVISVSQLFLSNRYSSLVVRKQNQFIRPISKSAETVDQ